MAYNLVLADRLGRTASVEVLPGGGIREMTRALATNHQHGGEVSERAGFTRTLERHAHLEGLVEAKPNPDELVGHFLSEPLRQHNYAGGFGTLFTAEYDPLTCGLALHWTDANWRHSLADFGEGCRTVVYDRASAVTGAWSDVQEPWTGDQPAWWHDAASCVETDWIEVGLRFARVGWTQH
jgi:hypothetical protein